MIFAALLLLAFGTAKAQPQAPANGGKNVNTIVVSALGDVTIGQADQYVVTWDAEREWHANYNLADTAVYLDGSADFFVTLPELNHLTLLSSGDVKSTGVLKGKNLTVELLGSGDVTLNLDYDNVSVLILGSGDVELRGKCNTLVSQGSGSGDLNIQHLQYGGKREKSLADPDMANLSEIMAELGENMQQLSDSVDWEKFEQDMEKWAEKMEKWGRKMEKWGERFEDKHGRNYDFPRDYGRPAPEKDRRPEKKSLLFDPNWNGFEAGLNMLLSPGVNAGFDGDYAFLQTRPMRSWVFNFNIADVGIAFDRRHTAGLYTGIGLGWNNYSFNNPVRLIEGESHLEYEPIDAENWKRSKLGVLYVQAPLMLEVRPAHRLYIAAGVTGGLRVDTWTKVKYQNGDKVKVHNHYYVNPFKLDASLRIGKNDGLGFFANYDLLPTFDESGGPTAHTVSCGFSLNF